MNSLVSTSIIIFQILNVIVESIELNFCGVFVYSFILIFLIKVVGSLYLSTKSHCLFGNDTCFENPSNDLGFDPVFDIWRTLITGVCWHYSTITVMIILFLTGFTFCFTIYWEDLRHPLFCSEILVFLLLWFPVFAEFYD